MKTELEVEKPDDATLILRRLLNAPQELAFQAWTAPEHIRHWMKPDPGMEVPSAKMDLRAGGRFRIQMQKDGGEYFTAAGVFQEVDPPRKLVYTWDWEMDGAGDDFGELEGKTTLVTVEFIARGRQTELIFTHSRFAAVASRDNHIVGWSRALQSFARFLEDK